MGFSQKNQTTWAITDTRLEHDVFFKEDIGREIAIDELGGAIPLENFLGYMELVSGGAKTKKIQDLKGLMRRQPIDQTGPNRGRNFKIVILRGSTNA